MKNAQRMFPSAEARAWFAGWLRGEAEYLRMAAARETWDSTTIASPCECVGRALMLEGLADQIEAETR